MKEVHTVWAAKNVQVQNKCQARRRLGKSLFLLISYSWYVQRKYKSPLFLFLLRHFLLFLEHPRLLYKHVAHEQSGNHVEKPSKAITPAVKLCVVGVGTLKRSLAPLQPALTVKLLWPLKMKNVQNDKRALGEGKEKPGIAKHLGGKTSPGKCLRNIHVLFISSLP